MSDEKDIPKLNDKQRRFCEEYCIDLDRNRAYRAAYPAKKSDGSIYTLSSKMLKNVEVSEYIATLQKDLSIISGVTALRNVLELKKLAYTNMSDLWKDWHELKEWKELTEDQRAAISEITESITTFGEDCEKKTVKVKLHSKLDAIEMLNKMLGFLAPEKHDINSGQGITLNFKPSTVKLPSSESEVIKNQKK